MINKTVGTIKTKDGTELYYEVHEKGAPAWMIITHGVGEHLDRHQYMVKLFYEDFNLLFYDLRGHGRSKGRRGHCESFSCFMTDLEEIIYFLKKNYAMKDFYLFGHSMGALITAAYLQNYAKEETYPKKTFLSAPPIGIPSALGLLFKYVSVLTFQLTKVPYSIGLKGLVDLNNLSHDQMVKEEYLGNTLNILKLETRLLFGMIDTANKVFSRPLRSKTPLYCAVGTGDKIVSWKAIREYFSTLEKGANLFLLEEAYHEMHNEIDKYKNKYFDFLVKSFNKESVL